MWLTSVWVVGLAVLKEAGAFAKTKQRAFLHSTQQIGLAKGLVPREGTIFKILQVADAHFGEDADGTWGPKQDVKSTKVIEAVLDEERPDLVVFSGDEITGEGLQGQSQIQKYWQRVVKPCKDRGLAWTMILGNHDVCQTEGCEHVVQRLEKKTTRQITLPQFAASSNFTGGRTNTTIQSKAVPTAAEELAEKRRKEEEQREAAKEGLKKEKEAEERLARIMGEGVRDIYPDDTKYEKEAAKHEAKKKAEEAEEAGYAAPEETAEAEVGGPAFEPGAPKKTKALGAKPDGKPRLIKSPQPNPDEPPMRNNLVPQQAKGREQLMLYDMSYLDSWTAREGAYISEGGGVTNYYLRLFKNDQDLMDDKPSAVLWFLDTGGGDTPETIKEDQVNWLHMASAALKKKYGPLPGILYMHIPSKDYLHINAQDNSCFGFEDDFITPVMEDQGLLALLAAAEIDWLMVGHDHGNDFCCPVRVTAQQGQAPIRNSFWNVHLCFGRHTGWGGYSTPGMHTRGARMLEIDLSMAKKFLNRAAGAPGINSWVRLENGMITGESPPIPQPTTL